MKHEEQQALYAWIDDYVMIMMEDGWNVGSPSTARLAVEFVKRGWRPPAKGSGSPVPGESCSHQNRDVLTSGSGFKSMTCRDCGKRWEGS